jgi:hypothetical protein
MSDFSVLRKEKGSRWFSDHVEEISSTVEEEVMSMFCGRTLGGIKP